MPLIELAQLLRPTTTPEQQLLLEHFYSQFDNGSAANKRIVNVEPLFYQGAIAGTEFLVYAVSKLYICYYSSFSFSFAATLYGLVNIYNETDTISSVYSESSINYETVTPQTLYKLNNISLSNYYFGRLFFSRYDYIKFIGYRITLV